MSIATLTKSFSPRPSQIKAADEIEAAIAAGKSKIFLNGPTGSGKSLIGAMVAERLQKKAVIVTATNALVEQYHRDFPDLIKIIGANNYSCGVRKKLFGGDPKADRCYKKSMRFWKDRGLSVDDPICQTCEFVLSRIAKLQDTSTSLTNYTYYMLDRLYVNRLSPDASFNHGLTIFDECHLIQEQFCSHNTIFYSISRKDEFVSDADFLFSNEDIGASYDNMLEIINENIRRGTIGLKNVETFLMMLYRFYNKMHEQAKRLQNWSRSEADFERYSALYNKYHGLFCKVDDYFIYKYEIVVDVNRGDGKLTVQPVFAGETSALLFTDVNIFMSATSDPKFLIETLAIDPAECAFIDVPYTFNQEDKVVDMRFATRKVNMGSMKNDAVLDTMADDIRKVLDMHQGQNGIVITTSFGLTENLAKRLKNVTSHRILWHNPEAKAVNMFAAFKESTTPTILISASLFEGVDFPNDESKFQVLVKAPFLSLGSRRIHYISRKYRSVYLQMTTQRMVQALGRSTRSKGDVSITYPLDANVGRVFRSKHNRWRNQFVFK